MKLIHYFKLSSEKEDFEILKEAVESGVDFKGTNLWILIFAIFIASLGLNVNSTAVIIGAMLVSPLMGPIIGMGFGVAINDIGFLKKAATTYLLTATISLATSTIYFLLTPLNEAHSEILSRTSPNIYDVLIAFCGGLAGVFALSSKLKGNVIPGVAIATALMPPLCTAGYGLATLQFSYFFGAFYLFLINTVFIALATLLTIRYLKFPLKQYLLKSENQKAKSFVWLIVILTIVPSIYLGFNLIQQNGFEKNAMQFIEKEAVFPNNFLLRKEIDAKAKKITLTFGGESISLQSIDSLKIKLSAFGLKETQLTIQQGFSYLKEQKTNNQTNQYDQIVLEQEQKMKELELRLDSMQTKMELKN